MHQVIDPQLQLDEQEISAIELDYKSRDDIPRILSGLQYIYINAELREQVFAILAEVLPERIDAEGKVSADTGRPGVAQWKILVLGTLRLGLNADYDRIQELANQHATSRRMLGHGDWADETQYSLQTVKENLRLFTPEILDRINQEVVHAGHRLVKKSPDEGLAIRADSFVVETDVHHPTDINMLLDAVRKAIETSAQLCRDEGLSDWRQSAYNIRQLKNAYRRAQQLNRSTSKDEAKRQERQVQIEQACRDYLELAGEFVARARATRAMLYIGCSLPAAMLAELDAYIANIEREIDQIRRRILHGERIPHAEKVFSVFERHSEWINKCKAGVPVELGLRVAICEDQHGFILHHRVMEKTTDDKIAIALVEQTMPIRLAPKSPPVRVRGARPPGCCATLRLTDGAQIRPRHVRDEPGKYGDAGLRGKPDRHGTNQGALPRDRERQHGQRLSQPCQPGEIGRDRRPAGCAQER